MKNKIKTLTKQDVLLLDLTLHNMPAKILAEFAEKIVHLYYRGSLNAAIQDLMHKALEEQDFVLSHITHIKTVGSA